MPYHHTVGSCGFAFADLRTRHERAQIGKGKTAGAYGMVIGHGVFPGGETERD